jgi:cyclic pyranopterin monophosphate synthase
MTEPHPESEARMVDVTSKDVTVRTAEAAGIVRMDTATRERVLSKELAKGDALEVARIAGIMAAKKTSELIPLCHPISLGAVEVTFDTSDEGIEVRCTVRTAERTGVEMEALTAVSVAALTIYDMVKGIDRGASITDVRLLKKSGGRSGDWSADA